MYDITNYSMHRAKQRGLEIHPSHKLHKKLDVYKHGVYVASVGDNRYSDYPTYIREKGKKYADERRRLYHERHPQHTVREDLARWLLW